MTMRSDLLRTLRHRYLTPITALQLCKCLSLSQRAGEFAREGWIVHKEWRTLPSGKKVRAYKIIGREKQ